MSQEEDNAWKDVLGDYFPDFLAFFFPEIHAGIDWNQPVEFLQQEFVPFLPQSLQGKALVDALVKVKLLGGEEAAFYIHVDVQGDPDPDFRSRMLRYNLHARERYDESVISLAILTDDRPGYRPSSYEDSRWGFRLRMDFPVVKLLDYRGREKELRDHPNPFSVVVLAHLLKLESPGAKSLYRSKLRLIRLLLERPYDRQKVRDFLRFLDWILRLPKELEDRIMDKTLVLEGKKNMPYLSNLERRGIERGHKQGLEQGREEGLARGETIGERKGLLEALALGLELRFTAQALGLLPRLSEVQDIEKLRRLVTELKAVPTLESFVAALERS